MSGVAWFEAQSTHMSSVAWFEAQSTHMSGVAWFRIESTHMSGVVWFGTQIHSHEWTKILHFSAFFLKVFLGAWQGMDLPSRVWSAETLDFGIHSVEEGLGMAEIDERTSAELQAELDNLQDCRLNLCVGMARA